MNKRRCLIATNGHTGQAMYALRETSIKYIERYITDRNETGETTAGQDPKPRPLHNALDKYPNNKDKNKKLQRNFFSLF